MHCTFYFILNRQQNIEFLPASPVFCLRPLTKKVCDPPSLIPHNARHIFTKLCRISLQNAFSSPKTNIIMTTNFAKHVKVLQPCSLVNIDGIFWLERKKVPAEVVGLCSLWHLLSTASNVNEISQSIQPNSMWLQHFFQERDKSKGL